MFVGIVLFLQTCGEFHKLFIMKCAFPCMFTCNEIKESVCETTRPPVCLIGNTRHFGGAALTNEEVLMRLSGLDDSELVTRQDVFR